MKTVQVSNRIKNHTRPAIWGAFNAVCSKTQSVNFAQGFPDWSSPPFLIDSLKRHVVDSSQQYTRSLGVPRLVEHIAAKHSSTLKRIINPMTEVVVTNGAVGSLMNVMQAFVNEGDEVFTFQPFYEVYKTQVEICGGKLVTSSLIQPAKRNKSSYKNYSGKFADSWEINWEDVEAKITSKTKLFVFNTPNNPSGKVFTTEELTRLVKILERHPNVLIASDEVYEHMVYVNKGSMARFTDFPSIAERVISIYSAGKTFSCTGIRVGWSIASEELTKAMNGFHQVSSFCLYAPIQEAVADCLIEAQKPYLGHTNYYEWLRNHYETKRNEFIKGMADYSDLALYSPEGAYFSICDISDKKVEDKSHRLIEGDKGNYTKDVQFALDFAHRKKVMTIPLSYFYTNSDGDNLIRFSFCKKAETMETLFKNLKV